MTIAVRHIETIAGALSDPQLLGASFRSLETWRTWLAVLKAAFGDALDEDERQLFASVAGGRNPPRQRVRELWSIIGRRGGKSRIAAALATFIATCVDHSDKLAPGEVGMVLALAASRSQAATVFNYALGCLEASPILAQQIESATADEIRLTNGIVIAVHSNSFRTVRGRTLLAVIFDEIAYWRDEASANPDLETYRAVLPSLATTGGMLIGISSPYRRRGLLHEKHRDFFGVDDADVLVIQGPSRLFNPTLDEGIINRARQSDPEAARAEWDAEFRSDLSAFLDDDLIDAAIDAGRPLELPPRAEFTYAAFVDASAGRHDAFCIGIGHREGDRIVADVIRGRAPPFDPAAVAAEYAGLAKAYRCAEVTGDNFSGEWVAAAFRAAGTGYRRAEHPKSILYLEGLPAFTRGLVEIPDHPALGRELRLLERRVSRMGRDTVDHPAGAGGADDHANVLFGVMWLLRGDETPAILAFYRDRLAELDGKPPAPTPKDPLPWREATKPPEPPAKTATYASVYEKTRAALLPKPQACARCGAPVVGTRVTDGFQTFCTTCV
jgi:hypothetical protein